MLLVQCLLGTVYATALVCCWTARKKVVLDMISGLPKSTVAMQTASRGDSRYMSDLARCSVEEEVYLL